MCTDFRIISDAYSQDCERRSIRVRASLVIARIPQWMSENELPYRTLRIQVVTGVPRYWWRNGIDPFSIDPRQRDPITYS